MLRRAKGGNKALRRQAGGKGKSQKINLCLRTYQFHLNFLAEPQTKHLTRLLLLLLLLLKKPKERKGHTTAGQEHIKVKQCLSHEQEFKH